MNTNPADLKGSSPDVDITPGGVDLFRGQGSSGPDRVRASGAVPGDTPATVPLEVNARGGDDLLGGGDVAPDALNGGRGRDTVTYGAALESVLGKINGQIYENNTVTGLDTLTGIETLIGSSQGDELSGDGGPNTLKGGRGGDLIHGRGSRDRIIGGPGPDELFGDSGIDSLFAVDRTRDTGINCGNGSNRKELARVDRSDPAKPAEAADGGADLLRCRRRPRSGRARGPARIASGIGTFSPEPTETKTWRRSPSLRSSPSSEIVRCEDIAVLPSLVTATVTSTSESKRTGER